MKTPQTQARLVKGRPGSPVHVLRFSRPYGQAASHGGFLPVGQPMARTALGACATCCASSRRESLALGVPRFDDRGAAGVVIIRRDVIRCHRAPHRHTKRRDHRQITCSLTCWWRAICSRNVRCARRNTRRNSKIPTRDFRLLIAHPAATARASVSASTTPSIHVWQHRVFCKS